MESSIQIFGAQAGIQMRYEGDIQSLVAKLSKGLILPDFRIAPREEPPHDIMRSVETEDSFQEISKRQMHDISPWLAQYVSKICKIDWLISGTRILFSLGKPGTSE